MTAVGIACLVLLLVACWTQPERTACDCQRCWYVNEPPDGAPIVCTRSLGKKGLLPILAFGGLGLIGHLLLRRKRGDSLFGGLFGKAP